MLKVPTWYPFLTLLVAAGPQVFAPAPLRAIDLVSGVGDPALLGDAAHGSSERLTSFAVDATGRYVAFQSIAADLAPGDVNKTDDIFVRDVVLSTTLRASTDSAGAGANGKSQRAAISRDGRFVVFESAASNLVSGDTNGAGDIFVKDLQSGTTSRVSTDSAGAQASSASMTPAISADGRHVAFSSYARFVVGFDLNGSYNIFVKDLQTGTTTRVSTDSGGNAVTDHSYDPAISGDGRFVVFESAATGLVSGDSNAMVDIFRKDRQTGETIRVSTDGSGAQANGHSTRARISADGRHVSFQSSATNLVADDTNGKSDVFVKDLETGATTRASTDAAGVQGNDNSSNYSLSDDGRYVLLQTAATNLVAGGSGGAVIRKNVVTGQVVLANADGAGVQAAGCDYPALSGDGRFVAFRSSASALAGGDGNGVRDHFLKDLQTGLLTLLSARDASVSGVFSATGESRTGTSPSADGRFVAFASTAANLVPGDVNAADDVFVKDMQSGAVTLASRDGSGVQGNRASSQPSISGDGRYLVFNSDATNLVEADTNNWSDVFLKDLQSGAVSRVSTDGSGLQANDSSYDPVINAAGTHVVFRSYARNLDGAATAFASHIFVRNLQTGAIARASANAAGVPADDDCYEATLSADGRSVAFTSYATNLVDGDTNGMPDVFVKDLQTGAVVRASTDANGVQGDDSSGGSGISADGRHVVFMSSAGNLAAGGVAGYPAAYVKDLQTGATSLVGRISGGTAFSSGVSIRPVISGNGEYVLFVSNLASLVSGDTNAKADIFLKELRTGAVTRVNLGSGGEEADGDSGGPAVTADGRYVTFDSYARNLVVGDGNDRQDVFRVFLSHPHADLRVSVSGPETVAAGETLTCTVGLVNDGPDTAQSVAVSVAVPAGSTFASAAVTDGEGWTVSAPSAGGTGLASFSKTAVPAGQTATFSFAIRIAPETASGSSMICSASVTTGADDPNPGNDLASASAAVETLADLAVVMTAPATVVAGATMDYAITISNAGPSDARTVRIEDLLPPGLSLVSQTQTSGPAFTLGQGNPLVEAIPALAAGASATFVVSASAAGNLEEGAVVGNTVVAGSGTNDPVPGNNVSSAQVTVRRPADLAVTVTAPVLAEIGGDLTCAVTVANAGPYEARNVTLAGTAPAGTHFLSQSQISGAAFTLGNDGDAVSNSKTALPAGGSATFNVTFHVLPDTPPGATLSATFSVTADTSDPDEADNSSTSSATAARPVELSVVIEPPGSGTVSGEGIACPDVCSRIFPSPLPSFRLTATPLGAYRFLRWQNAASGSAGSVDLPMDGDKTVVAVFARERTVCASGCEYDSIQEAIDAAGPGDTIAIASGVWPVNLSVAATGEFVLRGLGAKPTDTVLSGDSDPLLPGGEGSVLSLTAGGGAHLGAAIENLTVTAGANAGCGGGLHLEATGGGTLTAALRKVVVRLNSAPGGSGGGVCARALGSGTLALDLENVVLAENSATSGGGLDVRAEGAGSSATAFLMNNTVAGNTAATGAGALVGATEGGSASVTVVNTVVSGNYSTAEGEVALDESAGGEAQLAATFSTVRSVAAAPGTTWVSGAGMRSDTPVFVNAARGDFHLHVDSPCIDQGTASSAPGSDYEGTPRPTGAGVDIGADEHQTSVHRSLKLLTLTGGERIPGGRAYDITWGAPPALKTFKLYISVNGGRTWKLKATRKGATRHYTWVPPKGTKSVTTFRVRIDGFNARMQLVRSARSARSFTVLN